MMRGRGIRASVVMRNVTVRESVDIFDNFFSDPSPTAERCFEFGSTPATLI